MDILPYASIVLKIFKIKKKCSRAPKQLTMKFTSISLFVMFLLSHVLGHY